MTPTDQNSTPEQPVAIRRTGRRRVSTTAVPGSDPDPQSTAGRTPERATEDTDVAWGDARSNGPSTGSGENDERLRLDKPPHWQ